MAATFASPALNSPAWSRLASSRTVSRSGVRSEPRGRAYGPLGLGGLRLTRRGRLAVIALALLVSLPLAGFGGRAVAGEPSRPTEVTVHTVAPGETLWGFARQIAAPGQDVRDVVADLARLNELSSGALQVGQTILIPRR